MYTTEKTAALDNILDLQVSLALGYSIEERARIRTRLARKDIHVIRAAEQRLLRITQLMENVVITL